MTTTKTLPSGVLAQKNNFYALRILGSACEFTVDELTAVVACKGTCCRRGLFDVTALAQELQNTLLGRLCLKNLKLASLAA